MAAAVDWLIPEGVTLPDRNGVETLYLMEDRKELYKVLKAYHETEAKGWLLAWRDEYTEERGNHYSYDRTKVNNCLSNPIRADLYLLRAMFGTRRGAANFSDVLEYICYAFGVDDKHLSRLKKNAAVRAMAVQRNANFWKTPDSVAVSLPDGSTETFQRKPVLYGFLKAYHSTFGWLTKDPKDFETVRKIRALFGHHTEPYEDLLPVLEHATGIQAGDWAIFDNALRSVLKQYRREHDDGNEANEHPDREADNNSERSDDDEQRETEHLDSEADNEDNNDESKQIDSDEEDEDDKSDSEEENDNCNDDESKQSDRDEEEDDDDDKSHSEEEKDNYNDEPSGGLITKDVHTAKVDGSEESDGGDAKQTEEPEVVSTHKKQRRSASRKRTDLAGISVKGTDLRSSWEPGTTPTIGRLRCSPSRARYSMDSTANKTVSAEEWSNSEHPLFQAMETLMVRGMDQVVSSSGASIDRFFVSLLQSRIHDIEACRVPIDDTPDSLFACFAQNRDNLARLCSSVPTSTLILCARGLQEPPEVFVYKIVCAIQAIDFFDDVFASSRTKKAVKLGVLVDVMSDRICKLLLARATTKQDSRPLSDKVLLLAILYAKQSKGFLGELGPQMLEVLPPIAVKLTGDYCVDPVVLKKVGGYSPRLLLLYLEYLFHEDKLEADCFVGVMTATKWSGSNELFRLLRIVYAVNLGDGEGKKHIELLKSLEVRCRDALECDYQSLENPIAIEPLVERLYDKGRNGLCGYHKSRHTTHNTEKLNSKQDLIQRIIKESLAAMQADIAGGWTFDHAAAGDNFVLSLFSEGLLDRRNDAVLAAHWGSKFSLLVQDHMIAGERDALQASLADLEVDNAKMTAALGVYQTVHGDLKDEIVNVNEVEFEEDTAIVDEAQVDSGKLVDRKTKNTKLVFNGRKFEFLASGGSKLVLKNDELGRILAIYMTDHTDNQKEMYLDFYLGRFEERGIVPNFATPHCHFKVDFDQLLSLISQTAWSRCLKEFPKIEGSSEFVCVLKDLAQNDLHDYVANEDLTVRRRHCLLFGICAGILSLSKNLGYQHCDLKPANILVDRLEKNEKGKYPNFCYHIDDNEFTFKKQKEIPKVNDFDCAQFVDSGDIKFQFTTTAFASPDPVLKGDDATCLGQDSYALAHIMIYLYTGKYLENIILPGCPEALCQEVFAHINECERFSETRGNLMRGDGNDPTIVDSLYRATVLIGLEYFTKNGSTLLDDSKTAKMVHEYCRDSEEFRTHRASFGIQEGDDETITELREALLTLDVKPKEGENQLCSVAVDAICDLLHPDAGKRLDIQDMMVESCVFKKYQTAVKGDPESTCTLSITEREDYTILVEYENRAILKSDKDQNEDNESTLLA